MIEVKIQNMDLILIEDGNKTTLIQASLITNVHWEAMDSVGSEQLPERVYVNGQRFAVKKGEAEVAVKAIIAAKGAVHDTSFIDGLIEA